MKTSRVCALAGAAVSAAIFSVGAQAADLGYGGYGSVKDIPPPPAPSSRAWYLKGTIGMSNPEADAFFVNEPAFVNHTMHHEDIKSGPLYGIGIGVEHNRWLRFDLTGEYRGKQLVVGQDSYNYGVCPGSCGTNEYTADMESWLGLANAYVDLGTFRGITPYVGGGIGFASIDMQGFKDVNVPNNSVFYGDRDHQTTNFAWALYAGLSYDVTPQLTLDFAYRYTDLGTVKTGPATAFDGSSSYSGLEVQDITSHDLLFSARYRLDNPQPMYPVALK